MSTTKPHKLHIYFLPMMAPGHMIPMIDIAREFARRGAKSTIITTPLNASRFDQSIERDQKQHGLDIDISLIQFPSHETNLPEGCENLSSTTTPEMSLNFLKALDSLQQPVENILHENHPDCVIGGAYLWWLTDIALELNIPRINFYGTGFFPMCIYKSLKQNKPHEKVESDSEEFEVPDMPDVVIVSRRQLPSQLKDEENDPLAETLAKVLASEYKSYGMIVNSFYELEPDYARHYRDVVGIKSWHIGPVSLFNKSNYDKANRGKQAESDHRQCLSWLDSKRANSVIYVCFGSMAFLQTPQLREIEKGLLASGHHFIWVIKRNTKDSNWDHSIDEIERNAEGRGLIVRDWAPQVRVLEHGAVGGFVTHCGWNSVIEGAAVGVPMVTWPMSAEQFFNEKLVTGVLGMGVKVGAEEWSSRTAEGGRVGVKGESVERAVAAMMGGGEEGERMRMRARRVGEMARRAVEEGGSSDGDFRSLMEEIRSYHQCCKNR